VQSELPDASQLRARRPADDDFIVRLALRAFAEYSLDPGRGTLRMARAGTTWILERDLAPIGFAVALVGPNGSAELSAIAIDESERARGLGSALLGAVERELCRQGVRELTLHTAVANLSALQLFHKHGFSSERRLPRYYRGVFEACAMRKRLTPA